MLPYEPGIVGIPRPRERLDTHGAIFRRVRGGTARGHLGHVKNVTRSLLL